MDHVLTRLGTEMKQNARLYKHRKSHMLSIHVVPRLLYQQIDHTLLEATLSKKVT